VRERLNRVAEFAGTALEPDLLVAQVTPTAMRALMADPDVIRVSLDAPVRSLDTKFLSLDTLLKTEGLVAHKDHDDIRGTRYTGHDVGVAIIDSGIAAGNNDLHNITFVDFTNHMKEGGPYDDYGHGTHVAGLIASTGDGSHSEYAGLAPDAHLLVLKVLDKDGSGYTSDVIAAINFAVANKDRFHVGVINLSLGHPIYEPAASDPLVRAVENAVAAGVVVVASAGNFGGDPVTHDPQYAGITSPGNAPSAITIGALDTNQTVTRDDDTVAWYSSRGPTWYDGFQKPDIVAPGSHLISDVSTRSTLYKTYPRGIVSAQNQNAFMSLSGTSMAAGVVTGVVALMIDANQTNHHGAPPLTPNAIKAMLQYSAIPLVGVDTLTQGAGALNAAGAIALAAAVEPRAPVGTWWLSTGVNPSTTIGNQTVVWGQSVLWGDQIIWGSQIFSNDPAWGLGVIWGDRAVWGTQIIWGSSTVWGNPTIWVDQIIWGSNLLGQTEGAAVTWGNVSGNVTADHVVWGNLQELSIAPFFSSGNLERANDDLRAESQ
jgi:serine protease AprX